jgi:hypothetical protein
MSINSIGSNGSLRIHTRASQPRSSSNETFQEQFRSGIKNGIDLTNSALRQVAKPIPGSAALSASLSDAARNLGGASKLDTSISANSASSTLDGDPASLQDEMLRNNQDMLEQQMRVSQITTSFSTRSYILKAMFDALKTIGSNIR